jgi:multicomponent Na+:H+ antiporter subunit B
MKIPVMRMREKLVVRVVSRFFIPFILLFGLYVQFHGDFGPGGGFQAGVIFASAFVLYGLVYGLENLQRVVPWAVLELGSALGLLLYGGVGIASLLLDGNFLDYKVLDAHDPMQGLHLGILLVELGVGLTVSASMLAIFCAFAGRRTA